MQCYTQRVPHVRQVHKTAAARTPRWCQSTSQSPTACVQAAHRHQPNHNLRVNLLKFQYVLAIAFVKENHTHTHTHTHAHTHAHTLSMWLPEQHQQGQIHVPRQPRFQPGCQMNSRQRFNDAQWHREKDGRRWREGDGSTHTDTHRHTQPHRHTRAQ